jgi:muramoyltetrapeptide carboxypeptidase
MSDTLKARALPPGGTIGVPAPGWSRYDQSEFRSGVDWWESRGHPVRVDDRVFSLRRYLGDHPEEQAEEITQMFADPEVAAIQCYDAGYGAARIIPHLDFDMIAANPKPFVGYSDTTSLHTALRMRTGLVTFYGPLLSMMGAPERAASAERLLDALTSSRALGALPNDGAPVGAWGRGRATAELVGGCLWPILQSVGTPWQIDLAGKILFFEDTGKPPHLVCEQLTQLSHAGLLDGVAGVAIGEMVGCDWSAVPTEAPRPMSVHEVFDEHLTSLGVPVVYGLPLGHGEHLMTIPLGVRATVDADVRSLTIEEPALLPVGAEASALRP